MLCFAWCSKRYSRRAALYKMPSFSIVKKEKDRSFFHSNKRSDVLREKQKKEVRVVSDHVQSDEDEWKISSRQVRLKHTVGAIFLYYVLRRTYVFA
jgi:hypothetical protein